MTAYLPPASQRVAIFGATGSGKTHLLRRLWLARTPRQLILDATGEFIREPGVIGVSSDADLRRALYRQASRRDWRIAIPDDAVDLEALSGLLLPPFGSGRRSLSEAVNGLALVLDEAYQSCPHHAPPYIVNLFRRGRHAGLSIYAASQRPADVGRFVTAQAQWLAVCQTHEPNDLTFFRRTLPPAVSARIEGLEEHEALLFDVRRRLAYRLDAAGQVAEQIPTSAAAS